MILAAAPVAAGPVIPNFGKAHGCITDDHALWCWPWIHQHWGDTLQPRLVEHVWLTLLAVGIGFAIAFAAAVLAHRRAWFETPFGLFSAFVYTIPAIALFQLLVPFTGLTTTTIEIPLVGYTLLILFRNILAGLRGVPPDVLEAARGMGLTRAQIMRRVELPLALPAISAGLRIAVVTTISLATLAAYITPMGLGAPIFYGLQIDYHPESVVTGVLAIALALVADGVLVLGQRALTPWARGRSVAV